MDYSNIIMQRINIEKLETGLVPLFQKNQVSYRSCVDQSKPIVLTINVSVFLLHKNLLSIYHLLAKVNI